MTKQEFLNRIRSLHNIDGWDLPELTDAEKRKFIQNPVLYFIRCDDAQSDAIWREVEKRQRPRIVET